MQEPYLIQITTVRKKSASSIIIGKPCAKKPILSGRQQLLFEKLGFLTF